MQCIYASTRQTGLTSNTMVRMATKVRPRRTAEQVSVADLAALYNCSTRTVRRWEAQGLIRGTRVGPKLVRFNLDEVRQALESDRTRPAENPATNAKVRPAQAGEARRTRPPPIE